MNYDNRKLSLSLKSNTLPKEKTILLIPVNDREYLKLRIPEFDPLIKNKSSQYALLIADDRPLAKDSVPLLNNLLLDSWQKSEY